MGLERRIDYDYATLVEADADADPVAQLTRWLDEAEQAGVPEPNSMVVATVDTTGRPSMRNVLLRGLDEAGELSFYTNKSSHKGHDLAGNPNVCLLFSWLGLHRQVKVMGLADPVDDARNDEYFATRPRESQIGAWASRQSSVISGRDELDAAVAAATARFEGAAVPRPALGRLRGAARRVRVLAGPSQPAARPAALLPSRRPLVDRAALALTGPGVRPAQSSSGSR